MITYSFRKGPIKVRPTPPLEDDNDGVDGKNNTIDEELTGGEEGEGVPNEEAAGEEEGAVDATDREESDSKPIR